jgi:hypothetical protein
MALDKGNGSEASKWFQMGAQDGDPACALKLGLLYSYGHKIKRNALEGKKWLEKSAKMGYASFPGAVQECKCPGDGRTILYQADKDDGPALYLAGQDGSPESRVYELTRWAETYWSPSCDLLMIADGVGSNVTETSIFEITADGRLKKKYDLMVEFRKLSKDELKEFIGDHFYFEGVKWLGKDKVLIRVSGHTGAKTLFRLYSFNFKNGFKRLK